MKLRKIRSALASIAVGCLIAGQVHADIFSDIFNRTTHLANQNTDIFNRTTHLANQNVDVFNRTTTLFNQNLDIFNRTTTLFNQNVTLFNQNLDIFNRTTTLFNQNVTLFNQNLDIFNRTTTLFNQNVAIPGLVKSAIGDGFTIQQWLSHVMGPNWRPFTGPAVPYSLEAIYARTNDIAGISIDSTAIVTELGIGQIRSIFDDATQIAADATDIVRELGTGQIQTIFDDASQIAADATGIVGELGAGQIQSIFDNAKKIPGLATDIAGLGLTATDTATAVDSLTGGLASLQIEVDKFAQHADKIPIIAEHADKIPGLNTQLTALQTLPTQMSDVIADTQRLQTLVENVEQAVDLIPTDVIDKVEDSLADVQALVDFSLTQLDDALSNAPNHPDPGRLLRALEGLILAIGPDFGFNADLTFLIGYVNVMPGELDLAVGQALLTAGITKEFVANLEQAADDVRLLIDVIGPGLSPASPARVTGAAVIGQRRFLTAGSGLTCASLNEEAVRTTVVSARLLAIGVGIPLKIAGEVMMGLSKTAFVPGLTTYLGTHGYIGTRIESDPYKMAGGISAGVGEALMGIAAAAGSTLSHCEALHYQQSLMEATCRLNRFGGDVCARWRGSFEQEALISGSAL